jgi:hypothetical protein
MTIGAVPSSPFGQYWNRPSVQMTRMNRGFRYYLHILRMQRERMFIVREKQLHKVHGTGLWKVYNLLILQLLTNAKNMLT